MSKKIIAPLLLIIVILLLILSSMLFFKRYTYLQKSGDFRVHRPRPLMITTSAIQGWMTFDYLNRSFALPNDYLQKELTITNKKYPKVTLDSVAQSQGVAISTFVTITREKIDAYIPPVKN